MLEQTHPLEPQIGPLYALMTEEAQVTLYHWRCNVGDSQSRPSPLFGIFLMAYGQGEHYMPWKKAY